MECRRLGHSIGHGVSFVAVGDERTFATGVDGSAGDGVRPRIDLAAVEVTSEVRAIDVMIFEGAKNMVRVWNGKLLAVDISQWRVEEVGDRIY